MKTLILKPVDVIVTDFGQTRISKRSLAWLNNLDPEWRAISTSKRRGKHAEYVQDRVRRFENAVCIASEIAWQANDNLKEF